MNETLLNRYPEARVADAWMKFGEAVIARCQALGRWLSAKEVDADPVASLLARAEAYDASQPSYAADLRAAAQAHAAQRATERA